ncbi:MAG: hypothetical protein JO122_20650, partial [Acetobacteraceae bacterium]|nr:hypothetical protein [Acetobacteraceae bacterium]
MTALCPTGMLFVRCQGGISHSPAEAITAQDAQIALRVLLDVLHYFVAPPVRGRVSFHNIPYTTVGRAPTPDPVDVQVAVPLDRFADLAPWRLTDSTHPRPTYDKRW